MSTVKQESIIIKQPKTFDELIDKLESRNLIINNKEYAKNFIKNINYYRLSGYYKFFYIESNEKHSLFKEGTTFEDICDLYYFDKELRIILFKLMQDVEIMIRSHLAYYIAHNYSPNSYESFDLFFDCNEEYTTNKNLYFRENIDKKLNRSKEEFTRHYKEKYNSEFPIWVIVEALDFGDLSRIYKNMKSKDKKKISNDYYSGNSFKCIESWLEKSVILRNICAHHSRIVGRDLFNIKKNRVMSEFNFNGLFALLLGLKEIMTYNTMQWDKFVNDMRVLSNNYGNLYFDKLAFPNNWIGILENKI